MLTDRLHNDLIAAQKSGDTVKVSILRYLLADIKNREIELRFLQNTGKAKETSFEASGELSDSEVLNVIQKVVKQHLESIAAFRAGSREDLVSKEATELAILEAYLPPKLAEEDIKAEVMKLRDNLPEREKNDFGSVMKVVMGELRGRADGSLVQKLVREVIGT